MLYAKGWLLLLLCVTAFSFTCAQETKKPAPSADYSAEASVVEQHTDSWKFDNDGTGTRELSARVRIQSDAGVQHYGLLTFVYEKATETVDIDYVRVRKPDGATIATPLDDLQDMPTEVTREAPFYSDLREKQLAVKGLSSGDVLEYRCHWNMTRPLVPGQFWIEHEFPRDEITLENKLQVTVPRARAIKVKTRGVAPAVSEEGQNRVYTWTRSNLQHETKKKTEQADLAIHGKFPPPDVQVSSFQSWEEVGRWYDSLQRDRIVPSNEIRARAAELTRNAADDSAKIQAIYKYVSTQYRYIGVAFGIGRYQPHSAAEVLANQYGDCKDKHTLLASLLAAVNLPSYAALIHTTHALDPDVPSPSQFDHLITVVPRGKELLWLDTTAEVAPVGYLFPVLRDKLALVLFSDKAPALLATPATLPFSTSWNFKMDAKLDQSGTLTGKVEQTLRGDLEVILRAALRQRSRADWKEIVQQISYSLNFAGEVSDVTASMPDAIETPLRLTYTYHRKDYPDWSNHRVRAPSPNVLPLPFEEDGNLPEKLWLGDPGEFNFESRLELPENYLPVVPPNRDFQESFLEYHSTYSRQANVMVARYRIVVKTAELSGSKVKDYKTFAERAGQDHDQFISIASGDSPVTSSRALIGRALDLPASSNSKALDFEEQARTAVQNNSMPDAIKALEGAVAEDPKFTRDWLFLGDLYMARGNSQEAVSAFRKAVDSDPKQPLSYKMLAFALMGTEHRSDAIAVWQNLAKVAPDEPEISTNLGVLLVEQKRFGEAVPYLETAVKLYPKNGGMLLGLANAHLQNQEEEKANAIFEQALQLFPGALIKNDIAYQFALANKRLDDALRYSQEAVREEEDASQKVQLSGLSADDLSHTQRLAAFWDTLGWVHFRKGNLKPAEGYLDAAWKLAQRPTIGYHLAQVYEQQQ
ncbi:MAG TPA: DUF3857 domain-containing protein, partial [Candidatus Angelobacter sp.]